MLESHAQLEPANANLGLVSIQLHEFVFGFIQKRIQIRQYPLSDLSLVYKKKQRNSDAKNSRFYGVLQIVHETGFQITVLLLQYLLRRW